VAADGQTQQRRGRAAAAATANGSADKTGTDYVVLQRIDLSGEAALSAVPPGLHTTGDGVLSLWLPLRNEKSEHGPDGEVRIVTTARGDEHAIKLATKLDDSEENGGEAQRPGTFKAVPLRSWKGSITFKNRVVTQSEAIVSDD
jgi:hypothetical protein